MPINMNDFLNELGKSTVNKIKKEESAYLKAPHPKEQKIETIQETKEQENPKKVLSENNNTNLLNEDDAEKAIKFGSIMIETIKKTFDSPSSRRMAYEAVRSAVNMILGEQNNHSTESSVQIHKSTMNSSQNYMSEKEYDSIPKIQETQEQEQQHYKRDMNIISDGKEIDLSNITTEDINDFKVLSGIS